MIVDDMSQQNWSTLHIHSMDLKSGIPAKRLMANPLKGLADSLILSLSASSVLEYTVERESPYAYTRS